MRKVIDTNYLKSAELKEYLATPDNHVVIPDLVLMERLRGGDVEAICQQFELLMQHPKQVVVLKSTNAVAGLRKRRRRGLQRRRIDKKQTHDFEEWCKKLELARKGDSELRKNFAEKCKLAAADLAEMAKGQDTYAANLAEHAKKYSEAELNILRKGEPITAELLKKIKGHIVDLAQALFEAHPYFKQPPAVKHLPNAFLFRYAISGYIVALRRIKEGGANGASAEKIRNDLVDAMIAAHATYFDGLSSEDQKAKEIHETTRDLLKHFHEEIKAFASNQQKAGSVVAQERQAAIS
ncbi:hypothetical protein [Bradyrhizobium diazoefficiens]|uniref:hypothetical protein n=1 Tax=Bradyrhizobium diazoefficiens TaxID=1355477 RepID=UPI003516A202